MNITAPDFVVLSAFRYALGRSTYIVEDTVIWLMENWYDISEETQALIWKELKKAFEEDTEHRRFPGGNHPLGMDMDRAQWAKLLRLCAQGDV